MSPAIRKFCNLASVLLFGMGTMLLIELVEREEIWADAPLLNFSAFWLYLFQALLAFGIASAWLFMEWHKAALLGLFYAAGWSEVFHILASAGVGGSALYAPVYEGFGLSISLGNLLLHAVLLSLAAGSLACLWQESRMNSPYFLAPSPNAAN